MQYFKNYLLFTENSSWTGHLLFYLATVGFGKYEYLPLKNRAKVQQHNLLEVWIKCEICILSRSLDDLYTHYSFSSAAQIWSFQCEALLPLESRGRTYKVQMLVTKARPFESEYLRMRSRHWHFTTQDGHQLLKVILFCSWLDRSCRV